MVLNYGIFYQIYSGRKKVYADFKDMIKGWEGLNCSCSYFDICVLNNMWSSLRSTCMRLVNFTRCISSQSNHFIALYISSYILLFIHYTMSLLISVSVNIHLVLMCYCYVYVCRRYIKFYSYSSYSIFCHTCKCEVKFQILSVIPCLFTGYGFIPTMSQSYRMRP